jgi:hypothetical protein
MTLVAVGFMVLKGLRWIAGRHRFAPMSFAPVIAESAGMIDGN